MDLSDLIERNAAFTPDKPATIFEGEVFNYAAFSARIAATARALKTAYGVGRGDRVAILSLNRPDYLVLLYACARLGAMLGYCPRWTRACPRPASWGSISRRPGAAHSTRC